MAITCIVLDDEEFASHHLIKFINLIPFLQLQGSFSDPNEAISFLTSRTIDLIFLDIEMPNFAIDGMDFARILGENQNYIFTTGHPQYALKSYEFNAIDFLHKPFPFERFLKAICKARSIISAGTQDSDVDQDMYTYVRVDGRLQRIEFSEICWVESNRNYISIHTETSTYNLNISLSEIESQIPAKLFIRVHKSFIVAQKKIDAIEKNQLWVKRQGQSHSIPLGESFKPFKESIEQMILKRR